MTKLTDITNKKFGRLTAIEVVGTTRDGKAQWECLCECGKLTTVTGKNLRNGNTVSCGCKKKEGSHTTHGMSKGKNRIYTIWQGMRTRCNYKKAINYHNYGGRGIKVCERWDNFKNFQDDMEKSHIEHLKKHGENNTTLDRIDNSKGYFPKNCKWSTRREQYFNSRSVKIHEKE